MALSGGAGPRGERCPLPAGEGAGGPRGSRDAEGLGCSPLPSALSVPPGASGPVPPAPRHLPPASEPGSGAGAARGESHGPAVPVPVPSPFPLHLLQAWRAARAFHVAIATGRGAEPSSPHPGPRRGARRPADPPPRPPPGCAAPAAPTALSARV